MPKEKKFTKALMSWHKKQDINHPWKSTKDPYCIWLSEIIMQQTRIQQGTPYYLKFVEHYPTVFALAKASEEEVMKLWQGLGYYSRARNLHATAKYIVEECDGVFPKEYDEILKLKGVGHYTAAAISSFAFDLVYPVVDGNVERVISRVFGIKGAIKSGPTQKEIKKIGNDLILKKNPGGFNQAIMDFGANQCVPKNPDCGPCGMKSFCYAFDKKEVASLPFNPKKIKKKTRYFDYYVLLQKNQIVLRKRTAKDIWQNLFDFPCLESDKKQDVAKLSEMVDLFGESLIIAPKKQLKTSDFNKQALSHQWIISRFIQIEIKNIKIKKSSDYFLVNISELDRYAFPKTVDLYLNENSITLYNKER